MRGYIVVVEGDDQTGYSAYSPDLPGLAAAASDQAETERLMREAMVLHLELLEEMGEPIPDPVDAVDVFVVDPTAA